MSWSRRNVLPILPVLALAMLSLGGCCVHRCGGIVEHGAIGDDCGCGGPCTGDCGHAIVDDCNTCGDSCAPPCGGLFSPITYMLGCGSGCGEIYCDEWLSDPPECCDPCDGCGNWVGQPDWCRWHRFPLHGRNLWGTRHVAAAGPYTEEWHDGEVVVDENWSDEMMAPAEPDEEEEVAEPELEDDKPSTSQAPKAARSRSVLRGNAARPPRPMERSSR